MRLRNSQRNPMSVSSNDYKFGASHTSDCPRPLCGLHGGKHAPDCEKGTALVHTNVNRYVLKPICNKLGIPLATTHAFRHGRVSFLEKKRVPGDMIKTWIGHSSLKITSGYTHFSREDEREVIENLDD
jgi:integrase